MERTTINFAIEFPFPLSFSEREKIKKFIANGAYNEIENIYEEHRKRLFEEMSELVMNRFDLIPSQAKLITEYVLSISDTYNHVLNKLKAIKEARCPENV